MHITILLGGELRNEGKKGPQERSMAVSSGAQVQTILRRLGLPQGRVKLILVNGHGATLGTPLQEGDRVALFPPELSFNTFVSLSFRQERVEAREQANGGD